MRCHTLRTNPEGTNPEGTNPGGANRSRATVRLIVVAMTLALVAACDSTGAVGPAEEPSTTPAAAPDPGFPVTIRGENGRVTIDNTPERIVVLGPSLTETVFAVGAGPQVEAVDSGSNYPESTPRTALSAYQPNAEAISAFQPDLVLATDDANGLVDALDVLDIPVLILGAPDDLEDAYNQVVTVGRITGHQDDAQKIADDMADRVDAAVISAASAASDRTVYHELDPSLYSLTSDTFIGDLYSRFGLINIADDAPDVVAAGGYPQLSAEYVISSAPDVIVLADTVCCGQNLETVAQRPGFAELPAVVTGAVIVANDDIASRWGPRIVDFAVELSERLGELP